MSTVGQRRRMKARFFIAQQGKCWLCGEPMRNAGKNTHPLAATWDHVLPVSKGGSGKQDNLMLAHRECNIRRGDRHEVRSIEPVTAAR
jgi:5-methylcytosine-specific restriction endonuclease McrA